tara:strand:- start:2213 stop:2635 length:423 start_codon:yes stop_codon:yes gene_type:complete
MTVNTSSEDEVEVLRERLAGIPRNRLVEEVVSRWDDIIRLEGEVANLRRRVKEADLKSRTGVSEASVIGELEERLRISDSKVRRLEGLVQNEKTRREGAEADSSRLAELQEENARLLRNEEELLLLVLDMETQIDRLSIS